MTPPCLVRNSLIAGHAAVAMLALAAIHVALPGGPVRQWQSGGQVITAVREMPRRLPVARRTGRAIID